MLFPGQSYLIGKKIQMISIILKKLCSTLQLCQIMKQNLMQQVPSTPTLTNHSTSNRVELPSGTSETSLLSHALPTSPSSLRYRDNIEKPISSYEVEVNIHVLLVVVNYS